MASGTRSSPARTRAARSTLTSWNSGWDQSRHGPSASRPTSPAAAQVVPAAGETAANLFVVVPAAGICFGGALCSFGVVPLGFEADFEAWVASLDAVAASAPVVAPGQGPVGGEVEVRALQAYLEACLAAGGDVGRLADGPWRDWSHPEFHEVNVERAALVLAGEDRVPDAMLRLVGLA